MANLVDGVTSHAANSNSMTETLIYVTVAMVVLRFEIQRRTAGGTNLGSLAGRNYAASCKRVLCSWTPELAGIVACLTLAAALRARGDVSGNDNEAWMEIKAAWPLLMTADTLLALQAMLRLTLLISTVLRSDGCVPLGDEAAALWFLGTLSRVIANTRCTSYQLEGPLGGTLPIACDVATLPILLGLGRATLRKAPSLPSFIFVLVMGLSFRNHLSLSDDMTSNLSFMSAHFFDTLAGFAYLVRTLLIEGSKGGNTGVSVGFGHVLMPIQQSLSAYFFYTAFDEEPSLIASGSPFALLALSNAVTFGAYIGAAMLSFTECIEGGLANEPSAHGGTLAGAAPMGASGTL